MIHFKMQFKQEKIKEFIVNNVKTSIEDVKFRALKVLFKVL